MSPWCPTLGDTVPKCSFVGSQFVLGIKFGAYVEMTATLYHLKIYQGKEQNANATTQKEPLGTRVINAMLGIINSNSKVLGNKLYFNNFFTSYDLMYELGEQSIRATGTIRQNRTRGAKTTLISSKALQKKERDIFDFCTDGKVFVAKWHENSIVTIASNCETHIPLHKVNCQVKGGNKEVTQPHLINSYNKGMGGVELMDRLLETYRPVIRGKNGTGHCL